MRGRDLGSCSSCEAVCLIDVLWQHAEIRNMRIGVLLGLACQRATGGCGRSWSCGCNIRGLVAAARLGAHRH